MGFCEVSPEDPWKVRASLELSVDWSDGIEAYRGKSQENPTLGPFWACSLFLCHLGEVPHGKENRERDEKDDACEDQGQYGFDQRRQGLCHGA